MVNKLMVIGIDGLDYDVIRRYATQLPNLEEMQKNNGYPKMNSIFPADTTPAWSTIYLGVDPSVHGIVNFVNMADKENSYKPLSFYDDVFLGKTFWDQFDNQGFKCGIVLPMNIKTGWQLKNGIMITRPYKGKGHIYPVSKEKLYKPNFSLLDTDSKYVSSKKMKNLEKLYFDKANEEIRLTKELMKNEDLDFLFTYLSTTDGIQHDFWSYCDTNHPNYVPGNPFEKTIYRMYKKMDDFIGDIRHEQPNLKILVVSDHGHGARPYNFVRINQILCNEGFLYPCIKGGLANKNKKSKLFSFFKKVGLPKFIVKIAKKIPLWKKLFAPSDIIDWSKTVAYLSDLSAIKNYSYGGIRINTNVVHKIDIDETCDKIISTLSTYLVNGEKLFKWIIKTKTMYSGPYLNRYPEIIYQMNEKYGAVWDMGNNIFYSGESFNLLSPGGHRYSTAVIASTNFSLERDRIYNLVEVREIIESVFYSA